MVRRVAGSLAVAALAVAVPIGRAAAVGAGVSGGGPVGVQVVQTTADLSQALTRLPDARLSPGRAPRGPPVIAVEDTQRYQRFIGVGGGLTDSSAWLIGDELSASARASLLADLFGRSGIHLSFLRVPMGASDYTATGVPYTYDDLPPGRSDPSLAHMSIAHDLAYIVPTLRAALALNRQLYIQANPVDCSGVDEGQQRAGQRRP
jgi:glucosylceramidase